MRRIKLTVAYDGTAYCGWQIQPNGITVEEVLNRALSRLTGEEIHVTGASRTDAGVHARGNVAVFDTASAIPSERLAYAVNPFLPEDIVVVKSEEVPAEWHPRYQNSVKTYEYHILNREMPDPLRRRDSWHVSFPLDLDKMRAAAVHLVGEHDFRSFCSIHTGAKTTVRTICSLDIEKSEDLITIRISGNGFLYNMVRIIAGTLTEVGRGFRTPEEVNDILDAGARKQAGATAPPQGLVLAGIEYEQ
ncbi:MAG TPA: tRNA pseudouridine(38-40) synthase TruA [Candidatus Mediterraneibacter pullistercoris]|nr:tRNA pseudouridine(38-40) synthase TruA [Candidatus Mediterraneibacter pullistercoris]